MELPVNKKRLICVEYPGVVNNIEKALNTLGGESIISKINNDVTKRLELRWRPTDIYCKPACGDRFETKSLLLKIKRRKKKIVPLDGDVTEEYEYRGEIAGIIDTTFKFQTLADFQYLPLKREDSGSYTPLVDDLLLNSIKKRSWMDKSVALFLPPPIFSRIDSPVEYCYRDGPKHRLGYKDPMTTQPANLIGVARQRRPHYTIFCNFDGDEIPTEPLPEAVNKLKARRFDWETSWQKTKALFDKRPIWSKNGLMSQVRFTPDQFKFILPSLAYYWVTGPWRSLWCRFGFDPRKNPEAKIYQLVDFRVRAKSNLDKLLIKPKRSTYQYNLPNTVQKGNFSVPTIKQDTFRVDWSKQEANTASKTVSPESTYIFRPGLIPAYRQMFYQLCDIEEEEIQKLVHSNDGTEHQCTERDGWCTKEIQEKCRAIIGKHIKEFLTKNDPAEVIAELTKSKAKSSKRRKYSTDKTFPRPTASTITEEEEHILSGSDGEGEMAPLGDDEEMNAMETEMLDYMVPDSDTEMTDPD